MTSAIRSTEPALLRRSTFPFSTGTVTRFGTICPAAKFRFDTAGFGCPFGYTITCPASVGSTAVTFITTAVTPLAGTPFTPATCSVTTPPGPTLVFVAPVPSRVSRNREGVIGTNRLFAGAPAAVTVYALASLCPRTGLTSYWPGARPVVSTRTLSQVPSGLTESDLMNGPVP